MGDASIVGYAATGVGMCLMLPQIYKMLSSKRAQDVSWGMLFLFFLNCCLWLVYGILILSTPLMLANGIGLLEACILLALKARYRLD